MRITLSGRTEVKLAASTLCRMHLAVFRSLVNKLSNVILKPENCHHTTGENNEFPMISVPF